MTMNAENSSMVSTSVSRLLVDALANWVVRKIVTRSKRTGFITHPTVVAHTDEIGMRVVSTGSFELTQFQAVDMLLRAPERLIGIRCQLGGTFVDIGANIGLYATRYAPHFSKVIAVEANPATFHVLMANILLARSDNIEALCVGASNAKTSSHIHVACEGMIGWSRLDKQPWWETYAVPIELDTLDNLVRTRAIGRVSMLKIDVEGHELQVLQGSWDTLNEHGPVVLFEALNDDVARQAAKLLLDARYTAFFKFERRLSVQGLFGGLPVTARKIDPRALPASALICAVRQ